MAYADAFSYFMTVVAIAVAPGPVVLMLMVRSAGNDVRGAAGFGLGFAMGGVLIVAAVCLGLSTWLTAVPEVFVYSKYVMLAYILWLARGIWKGGFDLTGQCTVNEGSLGSAVLAGGLTCLLSPYMMILFPLVLPEMMDITKIEMPGFIIVTVLTFVAIAVSSALVVCLAAPLRKLARSARGMRIMNRSLATVLVSVGGWMALA